MRNIFWEIYFEKYILRNMFWEILKYILRNIAGWYIRKEFVVNTKVVGSYIPTSNASQKIFQSFSKYISQNIFLKIYFSKYFLKFLSWLITSCQPLPWLQEMDDRWWSIIWASLPPLILGNHPSSGARVGVDFTYNLHNSETEHRIIPK